jgi:DNA repair protein RadC
MAPYQTIKDWPAEDRPREKLLARGPHALSDTELLAIILRNGNASTGESAIDHARLLLGRFGGLKGMEEAAGSELGKVKGIGPAKVAQIKASLELARRIGSINGSQANRCVPPKTFFAISATILKKKNGNSSMSFC